MIEDSSAHRQTPQQGPITPLKATKYYRQYNVLFLLIMPVQNSWRLSRQVERKPSGFFLLDTRIVNNCGTQLS